MALPFGTNVKAAPQWRNGSYGLLHLTIKNIFPKGVIYFKAFSINTSDAVARLTRDCYRWSSCSAATVQFYFSQGL
jgi:hypothetical protein